MCGMHITRSARSIEAEVVRRLGRCIDRVSQRCMCVCGRDGSAEDKSE